MALEGPTESAVVREAAFDRHLSDRLVLRQQANRFFQTQRQQPPCRRELQQGHDMAFELRH